MSDTPEDQKALEHARKVAHTAGSPFFAAQGVPSGEFVALSAAEQKARNRRNLMLALSIGAFVVLVFVISIAKMHGGAIEGGGL